MAINLFSILHEAPEDEAQGAAPDTAPQGDAGQQQDAPPEGGGGQQDQGDFEDMQGDPDDGGGDDADAMGGAMDSGNGDAEGGDAPAADGGEEVNQDNTDMFATMSAEDQAMKITELKNLYGQLFSHIDDIQNKLTNVDLEDNTIDVITKISNELYNLKNYVEQYLTKRFNTASWYENEVMYNRFLMIIDSQSRILNKLADSTMVVSKK